MEFIPTKAEIEANKKQVLGLFTNKDELSGLEVSSRAESRTGGNKVFSDAKITGFLEVLVKEKKLSKKEVKKMIRGHQVMVTVYHLPKN